MPRILLFTDGPDDWKSLLADPEKHWRTSYSAKTLAHCWEASDGFPQEVQSTLAASAHPLLAGLTPLLAVPEFKVALPGGKRASQNDIFVLAKSRAGPVSIMVEGKVNESFGPTLEDWSKDMSEGKQDRLKYLLKTLALETTPAHSIRYQLLHRAASAIIVGEQYRAVAAVLLVHSFSEVKTGWSDYRSFVSLFGVAATFGQAQMLSSMTTVPLFAAWAPGNCAFLKA